MRNTINDNYDGDKKATNWYSSKADYEKNVTLLEQYAYRLSKHKDQFCKQKTDRHARAYASEFKDTNGGFNDKKNKRWHMKQYQEIVDKIKKDYEGQK